ncbi:hypothetical protein DSUL_20335 [Desulfovibrionales bacterium]
MAAIKLWRYSVLCYAGDIAHYSIISFTLTKSIDNDIAHGVVVSFFLIVRGIDQIYDLARSKVIFFKKKLSVNLS